MDRFKYIPDDDIKIEKANAVRQLCSWLRSHEDGVPEWVKNASDAYLREDKLENDRIVVVIFDYGRKRFLPSISCLDFAGMTSKQLLRFFRVWADPDAHLQDSGTFGQGGHGQGGKCYMTQMFSEYSTLYTVREDKGNNYGVRGGEVNFGFVPDRKTGRDFYVGNLQEELNKILTPLRLSIDKLPRLAKEALGNSEGFTLISGFGPNIYGNRIPTKSLTNNLRQHPEMILSLESCKVFVISNGSILNARRPLESPSITPIEGAESPREFEIPSKLTDTQSGKKISTTNEGKLQRGKLVLHTSERSMRWTLKGRHTIRFLSGDFGRVGYRPVPELDVSSGYKNHIYGECYLDRLREYKQLRRAQLADSPLTRAIYKFVSESVESYAKEFEARDRKKYSKKDKSAISKMNSKLDKWKNRFLKEAMSALWGTGDGNGPPPPLPSLPKGEVARIELRLTHNRAGLGITMRPTISHFDDSGKRVQPIPIRFMSEDNNVAMAHGSLNLIETFSFGKTGIWAESIDGRVRSNSVPIEVVHIKEIKLSPESLDVPLGSRQRLEAFCTLDSGEAASDILLLWLEDNSSIVRVSSAGLVYGLSKGETKVTAMDSNCDPSNPTTIKVTEGKGTRGGRYKGAGYPLVLISGEEFDADPETGEWRIFSPDEGPVCYHLRDVDRNIWWINSASPLATVFLDRSKGYGPDSKEWRIYHVERYIDVIVQILFTQTPEGKEDIPADRWITKWMFHVSDIQIAIVLDLEEFIESGELEI